LLPPGHIFCRLIPGRVFVPTGKRSRQFLPYPANNKISEG
jgi:hypothetical protein